MKGAEAGWVQPDETHRRKGVRRTVLLCTLVALAFYFGFIVMMLVRGSK